MNEATSQHRDNQLLRMKALHRKYFLLLAAAGLCFMAARISAADWPQWRGPGRDGHSLEKGLLKEWPAAGPKLAWKIADAGSGYSTPAVVGDRLYFLSNDGLENESAR